MYSTRNSRRDGQPSARPAGAKSGGCGPAGKRQWTRERRYEAGARPVKIKIAVRGVQGRWPRRTRGSLAGELVGSPHSLGVPRIEFATRRRSSLPACSLQAAGPVSAYISSEPRARARQVVQEKGCRRRTDAQAR